MNAINDETPAEQWRREDAERHERTVGDVARLLADTDLVQRTRNLLVYVTHRDTAAARLGVPPAFIDAVMGSAAQVVAVTVKDAVKTGVVLEAARLARVRAAPRELTPLEKERARLESVRKERERAKERPFKRARASGVHVYRPPSQRRSREADDESAHGENA